MDWLNTLTKDWSLKKSYVLYQSIFFMLGILLGKIFGSVLRFIQINFMQYSLNKNNLSVIFKILNSILFSNAYNILIYVNNIIVPFVFIILGFYFFYKHKFKIPIHLLSAIDDGNEYETESINQDELAIACNHIIDELYMIQKNKNIEIAEQNLIKQRIDAVLHDIKNPLASLKGDVSILKMTEEPVTYERLEIYNRLERCVNRVENYLNRLTEKDALEKIQASLRQYSVEEIYNKINEELTVLNINAHIFLEKNISKHCVQIDPLLFFEAIDNILSNAQRFKSSSITINVLKQNDRPVIQFCDDGPGFSEKALVNYSRCYYSDDSTMINSGLGLYIAKILLEKQRLGLNIYNNNGAVVEILF